MTEEEIKQIGFPKDKRKPKFIKNLNLPGRNFGFSTNDSQFDGLVLLDFVTKDSVLKFQKDSWKKFGHLGNISTDMNGIPFTAQFPLVNNYGIDLESLNRILFLNPETGEMEVFMELPKLESAENVVFFGILALYFDEHSEKLYVSSVMGSTRDKENGKIYLINTAERKVEDVYENLDVFSLFVCGIEGEKRLYMGRARNSEVVSIKLNKSGEFVGKHEFEFSLDQLGPKGDDKARRIRYDNNGRFMIIGADFDYSYKQRTESQENVYVFQYDYVTMNWVYVNQ